MFTALDVTTLGRNLATSALPCSPIEETARLGASPLRAEVSRMLRRWARAELELAGRLDPCG